jgi:hypothetical protein
MVRKQKHPWRQVKIHLNCFALIKNLEIMKVEISKMLQISVLACYMS